MIKILYIPEGTYLYFYHKHLYAYKTVDFIESDIMEYYTHRRECQIPKSILKDIINDTQWYYHGWEAFLDSAGKNKIIFREHSVEEFEIIYDNK